MKNIARSTYATYDSQGVTMDVYPDKPGTYMIINAVSSEFDTLIDAMRYQAAKNKEICDEMIAKEKDLKLYIKFADPSAPWNWKK